MTARERFLAIAKGDLTGEVFLPCDLNYDWFMNETIERWQGEGLPAGADPVEFFDLDRIEFIDGQPYGFVPPFEPEIIAEDQDTRTIRDELGVTKRIHKTHEDSTMPQWLDFPVRSRQDFRDLQRRLDPQTPARYPANLETLRQRWQQRDHPLGIGPGSFYGHTLQRWVGPENLCMLFYDDPRLVHEMLDYLEQFFLGLLKQLLPGVRFDFASFGEDIAFKGRSFISPRMFRE
ncbi:hypothetical protein HQ590_03975, partial [bacterium]|nr:hypothetical protein [bacterium]